LHINEKGKHITLSVFNFLSEQVQMILHSGQQDVEGLFVILTINIENTNNNK